MGRVESKILWRLGRLETDFSNFELKECTMVKLYYKLKRNHPYFINQTRPSPISLTKSHGPLSLFCASHLLPHHHCWFFFSFTLKLSLIGLPSPRAQCFRVSHFSTPRIRENRTQSVTGCGASAFGFLRRWRRVFRRRRRWEVKGLIFLGVLEWAFYFPTFLHNFP